MVIKKCVLSTRLGMRNTVSQGFRRVSGFTLIELLIVVAIIGILSAIAYPSYQNYLRKTKRTDAQADMIALANQLQRFKIANFSFKPGGTAVTLSDIGSNGNIPSSGTPLYTVALSDIGGSKWTMTATPIAGTTQANDGLLILNQRGEKCWTKNGCTKADATSNWDQ